MIKYNKFDIDDYMNRLTEEQACQLIKHCNKYGIAPEICAWYDNMDDFYQDWIYDNNIYDNKEEAKARYEEGKANGEFKKFKNGEIVRLCL